MYFLIEGIMTSLFRYLWWCYFSKLYCV